MYLFWLQIVISGPSASAFIVDMCKMCTTMVCIMPLSVMSYILTASANCSSACFRMERGWLWHTRKSLTTRSLPTTW